MSCLIVRNCLIIRNSDIIRTGLHLCVVIIADAVVNLVANATNLEHSNAGVVTPQGVAGGLVGPLLLELSHGHTGAGSQVGGIQVVAVVVLLLIDHEVALVALAVEHHEVEPTGNLNVVDVAVGEEVAATFLQFAT